MFQKDEYFVLILGLDNAGKTTLLEQLKRKFGKNYRGLPFEKITATVGMNIGKIDFHRVKLVFWDLGGQEELQTLWDKYYEECHGVIYVIDSSDQKRLEESHTAFDHVIGDETLQGAPILVLANKQDIEGSLDVDGVKRVFSKTSSRMERMDCLVQPASVLKGEGIDYGLEWIVDRVKSNLQRPTRPRDIT